MKKILDKIEILNKIDNLIRDKKEENINHTFDLIITNAYMAGRLKEKSPLDESKKGFEYIKKLLLKS